MEILGRFRVNVLFVVLVTFMVLSGMIGQVYAEGEGNTNQVITQESSDSFEFNSSTGTILKYNGAGGDVAIPDQIDGVAVKCIGNKAFWNNKSISRVVLPEGVETIDTEAFSYCENLTEVLLPASLLEIRDSAFEYANINNLVLPDNLTTVGSDAFEYNAGLTHVYVSKSVSSLKSSAFIGCYSLTQIEVDSLSNDFCTVDNVLFSKDQTKLITYACGKTNESYQVPASVKTIDKGAFMFAKLKSITLPEGLEIIGSNAFASSSIQEIRIPDSVTEIGYYAFYSSQLITFYTSENSQINKIEYNCFDSCTNLTEVLLPKNLDKLETRLFLGCTNLKEIVIPESITAIDSDVFAGCSGLSKIQLPTNIRELGSGVFSGCSFQSLDLPNSIETMGTGVFAECKDLIQVSLPGSLTKIPSLTFYKCSQLGYYQIPEQIKEIGDSAFSGCVNLEKVDTNSTLQTIGKRAFQDCIKLINIVIPKSVNSVEDGAFHNCAQLKTIVFESAETVIKQETPIWWNTIPVTATMIGYEPSTAKSYSSNYKIPFKMINNFHQADDFYFEVVNNEAYIFNYVGDGGEVVIPSQLGGYPVTVIGGDSIRDNDDITSVTISEGVREIRSGSFYNNQNMKSIELPESLVRIENNVFDNCKNLEEIYIPKNVAYIEKGYNNSFLRCEKLTKISVDEDNQNYQSNSGVLYNKAMTELIACPKSVIKIEIPEGIKVICDGAFWCCQNLTEVKLPNSLETIGAWAFNNCTKLQNITIPDSVTQIGRAAFFGCWAFTEISLPPNLTKIETQLFYDCRNLQKISFMEKVESIGNQAFIYCGNLESFIVPEYIKSVGVAAFWECNKLGSIQFNSSGTEILTKGLEGSPDDDFKLVPIQTKIIGYENSTAKTYASQFGNSFQSLGSSGNEPQDGTKDNSDTVKLTQNEAKELFQFLKLNEFYGEDSILFNVLTNKFKGTDKEKIINEYIILTSFYTVSQRVNKEYSNKLEVFQKALTSLIQNDLNSGGGTAATIAEIAVDTTFEELSSEDLTLVTPIIKSGSNSYYETFDTVTKISPALFALYATLTLSEDNNQYKYLAAYIEALKSDTPKNEIDSTLCMIPISENPFSEFPKKRDKLKKWGDYLFQIYKNIDKNITKKMIADCPVTLNILNSQGEVVLSLSDDNQGVILTDFGEFSVVEDTVNGGFSKSASLYSNDYTFQIVGTGTGTMNLEYIDYSGDAPRTATTTGVSINKDMIIKISSDIHSINLSTDSNGDGQTDSNQALALEMVVPTDINLISSSLELEVNHEGQILAEVLPQLSSQSLEFQSQNSAVATADLTGRIKAISAGETDIFVKIPGSEIVKTCHVKVTQSTAPTGGGGGGGGVTPTPTPNIDVTKALGEITKASGGSTVTVSVTNNEPVPISILEAAKGKDISIVFNYGSYTWTINGKSIQDLPAGVSTYDLSVKTIQNTTLSNLANDPNAIQIEISHNGAFPFTGQLSYQMGASLNGKTVYRYYFNETDKKLEYQDQATVKDGVVRFDFEHASKYVISALLKPEIASVNCTYQTQLENIGWQGFKNNGEVSGTVGESLRLEGIEIKTDDPTKLGVTYQTHVQNIGWQGFKKNGELSGTTGESLRLEAIQIKLTGSETEKYDVYYQVYTEKFGWLDWAKNGESAGSEGYSYRLEAIRIVIQEKGTQAPGSTDRPFEKNVQCLYQTHVQNIGWQGFRTNGDMSGTQGQALRLEGIEIKFDGQENLGVEYSTHVQNIGWQDFVKDSAMSGTEGKSLRLEAIKIKLTGTDADKYDIYYQVHAQNFGWLDWAKNGEEAGTAGFGYRLEGIKIIVVPKGGTAPGVTARPFIKN